MTSPLYLPLGIYADDQLKIEDAVREGVRLATLLRINVYFEFQSWEICCAPDASVDEIVAAFNEKES